MRENESGAYGHWGVFPSLLLLCALALCGGDAEAQGSDAALTPGVLLVANRSSHEVTFVDIARGEVVARVATGEGPHLLSNVNDGQVLATGYGEFPRPHADPVDSRPVFAEALNSRVTLIDVDTRRTLLDTTIGNCAKPHASWIVGQRGFVTCESARLIQVISLPDGKMLHRISTQQSGSHVLGYEPASRMLGVSNVGSGSITLIDVDNGNVRAVSLAPGSEGALAVDGKFWVANTGDGSVSVVDSHSASEVARIESVCGFPIAFSRNPGSMLWLACFASAELVAIDPQRREVQRRIRLPAKPLNVILHPHRNLAYVSYPRQNAVGEIDLDSSKELRRIAVGIEPDGLRWAAPGNDTR